MKPTLERLTERFTQLVGPGAFAKAEAAIAAAQAAEAAAAAAKAAAAAAAPKPVAATAASPVPVAAQSVVPAASAAPVAPKPPTRAGVGAAVPPASTTPATPKPAVVPPSRPVAPTAPAPAPMPTLPVQAVTHAAKGYDLEATVAPDQVVEAAELLDGEGFALDTITGVDWIAQNEMEVVYDYFHPVQSIRMVVRTRVPRSHPELPTIVPVFAGANWHERETHDFFGIRFTGHPNLKPFLLPEDADFHPLRKDYKP